MQRAVKASSSGDGLAQGVVVGGGEEQGYGGIRAAFRCLLGEMIN